VKAVNYGPLLYSRTNSLNIDIVDNLPNGAIRHTFLDNVVGKALLNGWQFSAMRPHGMRSKESETVGDYKKTRRGKLWSHMPWCLVPVFQPDFDCGGPLFDGRLSWETRRARPRWRVCDVIADRAERLV
jgi:hypothetical protein